MTTSGNEEVTVEFYEPEYDKAYEKKPSFNEHKPTIAGLLLIIPVLMTFVFALSDLITQEEVSSGGIAFFFIFLIVESVIFYAGFCSLKKIKHRFSLFGATLSFVLPYNYFLLEGTIIQALGIQVNEDYAGLFFFLAFTLIPIFTMYLIFTSDDEFSS